MESLFQQNRYLDNDAQTVHDSSHFEIELLDKKSNNNFIESKQQLNNINNIFGK
jgi:hypothetical protein